MQIEYYHFLSTFKPPETMQAIETLKGFSKLLSKILVHELAEGNMIMDVATGWPDKDSIAVSLQYDFLKDYEEKDIRFENTDDLHYGGAKYLTNSPIHILTTSKRT